MAYQFPPDVEQLVREQMAHGGYASEDDLLRDALCMLRAFTPSAEDARQEYRETVAAVSEGAVDMEAGRLTPLRQLRDHRKSRTPGNSD